MFLQNSICLSLYIGQGIGHYIINSELFYKKNHVRNCFCTSLFKIMILVTA